MSCLPKRKKIPRRCDYEVREFRGLGGNPGARDNTYGKPKAEVRSPKSQGD